MLYRLERSGAPRGLYFTLMATPPLIAFLSYAAEDSGHRADLERHLAPMKRQLRLDTWQFGQIVAGTNWDEAIRRQLECADLVILLITARFLASRYCYDVELRRALERHNLHEALVVPVIVEDCDWRFEDFARLQVLPSKAKPVCRWKPRSTAWTDVVAGLRQAIEVFVTRRTDARRARGKILAVEPNQHFLRLYRESLEPIGYTVVAAKSGGDARKLLSIHDDIAAVVLDLDLSDESADDWLTWHYQLAPERPVIVTGQTVVVLKHGRGVVAAYHKPFPSWLIVKTLDAVVTGQPLPRYIDSFFR